MRQNAMKKHCEYKTPMVTKLETRAFTTYTTYGDDLGDLAPSRRAGLRQEEKG